MNKYDGNDQLFKLLIYNDSDDFSVSKVNHNFFIKTSNLCDFYFIEYSELTCEYKCNLYLQRKNMKQYVTTNMRWFRLWTCDDIYNVDIVNMFYNMRKGPRVEK